MAKVDFSNLNTNSYGSRKWNLTLLIVILGTVGTFLPPLLSKLVFKMTPIVILSGTEWVTLMTMITSAYFAGNVWEKREKLKTIASVTETEALSSGVIDEKTDPNTSSSEIIIKPDAEEGEA